MERESTHCKKLDDGMLRSLSPLLLVVLASSLIHGLRAAEKIDVTYAANVGGWRQNLLDNALARKANRRRRNG